jgi:glyceraldehyde-3-phosphate dehydrogenase (NADP+)
MTRGSSMTTTAGQRVEQRDFLVGGTWRTSAERDGVVYPYTGETIAEVGRAGPGDVEDAIVAAVKAFDVTRHLPAHHRSAILSTAAHGIEVRAEFLARQISLEAGIPVSESEGEVTRTVAIFRMAADATQHMAGEIVPLDVVPAGERRYGEVRRFPIGPVTGITAFNAPLLLPAHKIASAFAAGNPVIVKPAPRTPLSALSLAAVLLDSGMPEGALSVVPCDVDVARPLITDDRIKALSFTGSAQVGWALKGIAGRKKVTLELGGNGAVVVHSDADLDWAAARCAFGGFLRAGQSCIGVQRIYVHREVYESFLARLVRAVKEITVGDPLDPQTRMGPLIDETAARRAEAWVEEAREAGATVCVGGGRSGSFFEPTVLTDVSGDMKVVCEEVFAPMVVVSPYDDFDEALRCTNASTYGLQAGVFSNNLELVYHAYEELEVGGVIINDVNTWRVDNMPYGGIKASGFGREGVKYAMEDLTEPRLLVLKVN